MSARPGASRRDPDGLTHLQGFDMQTAAVAKITQELAELASTEKKPIKWYNSRGERISLQIAVGAFAAALLAAIASNFWWEPVLSLIAMIMVAATQISAIVYQGFTIWHGVRTLRNPMEALLRPMADDQPREYVVAESLSRFAVVQLQFVLDNLKMSVRHFQVRTKVIAGAIEQVGVIPSMLAFALAVKEQVSSDSLGPWAWVAGFLVCVHLLSMYLVGIVQSLEKKTLIVETALRLKGQAEIQVPRN